MPGFPSQDVRTEVQHCDGADRDKQDFEGNSQRGDRTFILKGLARTANTPRVSARHLTLESTGLNLEIATTAIA